MKSIPLIATVMIILLSGCVGKKKFASLETEHRNLQSEYRQLNDQHNDKLRQLSSATARISSLEEQLGAEKANNASLRKALAALQQTLDKSIHQGGTNISKLVDEINASNKYIQHLVNTKNRSDSLNLVLTNRLTRSLSQEELRDVDVQVLKGVVYISLSDNMLYRSGSYEISNRADETLSKIAKIIMD